MSRMYGGGELELGEWPGVCGTGRGSTAGGCLLSDSRQFAESPVDMLCQTTGVCESSCIGCWRCVISSVAILRPGLTPDHLPPEGACKRAPEEVGNETVGINCQARGV